MNEPTDSELLSEYATRDSDSAFARLVDRHLNLVYSVALRVVVDPHLAENVTQTTFVALARAARRLIGRPFLAGWLHRTSFYLAAKTVRGEMRRRACGSKLPTKMAMPGSTTFD